MSRERCLKRHLLHASVEGYHRGPLYSGPARWTEGPVVVGAVAGSQGDRRHLPYPGFGYGEHVCEPECRHDWR